MPFLLAIGLAGLSLGVFGVVAYRALATGIGTMDRPAIRWNVLKQAELKGLDPKVFMALIQSESNGDPNHFLGDFDTNGQPCSFGPGQFNVYKLDGTRSYSPTALQFAYTGDGSDLMDEATGIEWCARVFKDKLDQAQGVYSQALLLYKGGSHANATAVAERDQVIKIAGDHYGIQVA